MTGFDESVEGRQRDLKGKVIGLGRWVLPLVCIIGALIMTLVGLDLLSAVDMDSDEFREAYINGEKFVLHGTITYEDETRDDGTVQWTYLVESEPDSSWPASVSSEFDLGEVGDEVFFKATKNRGGGGIPEYYYITAESGPISPIVPWVGLAMVIFGLSGMVLLEKKINKRVATTQ